MRNILVLGGTGFVGRAVCERLVERNGGGGGRITVVTRRITRGNRVRFLPTVELAHADVNDAAALAALVAGHDAVINLVGILHGNDKAFEQAHVALPRSLAAACAQHGVRRVIHISAIGVAEQAPSEYLRGKAGGEAALKSAGLDLTLLRPSVIFGAEDRFLNLFAQLQSVLPVMALAGGTARFQPVWVEDVAGAIVACLDRTETIGQTFELAGPQVYTLSELVRLAGRWSGHERAQLPLPMVLGRLQALVFECLPGQPLVSRDNLESMQVPNVAGGALPGLPALGIAPTALEVVAPSYLGQAAGRARLNRLRAVRAGTETAARQH